MNKAELTETVRQETGLKKDHATEAVKILFDAMSDALAGEDRVEIRGLCSFFVKEYGSYNGRNPKTGQPVRVKPKKLPFFKCGKELKERVDSQPVV